MTKYDATDLRSFKVIGRGDMVTDTLHFTIGHELNSKRSLLEWFLQSKGQVNGYHKAIFDLQ